MAFSWYAERNNANGRIHNRGLMVSRRVASDLAANDAITM